MKRIWIVFFLLLLWGSLLYADFSRREIKEYHRYILSLIRLGMKDLATEKLEYAFKKYGKKPIFLELSDELKGKKKSTFFIKRNCPGLL